MEAKKPVPTELRVDRVISVMVMEMLKRGQIREVVSVLHAVEFVWVLEEKEGDGMQDYAVALNTIKEACGWQMRLQEDEVVSEPEGSESVSEEEMK